MPIKDWEFGTDEDDYIGIRYRVVMFDDDERRVASVGLRGLKAARTRMMDVIVQYTVSRAEALGRKMVVGSKHAVKIDAMDNGLHMRVNFREGPMNFAIEEDTCDAEDLEPWGHWMNQDEQAGEN